MSLPLDPQVPSQGQPGCDAAASTPTPSSSPAPAPAARRLGPRSRQEVERQRSPAGSSTVRPTPSRPASAMANSKAGTAIMTSVKRMRTTSIQPPKLLSALLAVVNTRSPWSGPGGLQPGVCST